MDTLLDIDWDLEARVVSRPNRFLMIADVLDGTSVLKMERVHVHDPGRLKEVVFPGNKVRVRKARTGNRSTGWDLISGKVGKEWVLVNSSFHSRITASILKRPSISPFGKIERYRPEVKVDGGRLDFALTGHDGSITYVEVKGCTLSENGTAFFPDAPTVRGTRHLNELIRLKKDGYGAAVIFLVLAPDAHNFSPNGETDPTFARTLEEAERAGVGIFPIDLDLEGDEVVYRRPLPLVLR